MLSGCAVSPDSKDTNLGSSNQEASPSAGKNTRVVLVPLHTKNCVSITNSSSVDGYFRGRSVPFVTKDEFSVRDTKIT